MDLFSIVDSFDSCLDLAVSFTSVYCGDVNIRSVHDYIRFVWNREFSARVDEIEADKWRKVDDAENKLERILAEEVAAERFTPQMSLALHDGLLRTIPRV